MFLYAIPPGDIIYDIETYPNVITLRFRHATTGERWNFEISFRRYDLWFFCRFVEACRDAGVRWVGFNNVGFDYPVIHFIYKFEAARPTAPDVYAKAMDIIKSYDKFAHVIWDSDQVVRQVDLYKIHHFDNKAKATSLKVMEFNMRMSRLEDLPFPVGTELDDAQADVLIEYNDHDIEATYQFYNRTLDFMGMRRVLSEQFRMDLTNANDVKIGERILVHEMKNAGVDCYEYINGRREPKQTIRDKIRLVDVIFPYVQLDNLEFQWVKDYLVRSSITETVGIFKDLVAVVAGCEYKFGTGGLHMSVHSQVVTSDDRYQLIDVDVASYYPNLAIKNKVHPAHLGPAFCDTLERIYNMRKEYPKTDPRNGALKLALNGVYGLSNNMYSPFYDAQYTMAITINGQLLLCMLIDQLSKAPGLQMIQANTDGITYLCPREHVEWTRQVCRWWESVTKLELEEVLYSRMFIRDVNNYIAEKEDGSLKRIGAYAHETAEQNPTTRELPYHKDWSARVVPLAAEANLVRRESIADFITNHQDTYDFMLRTKVPRGSKLEWGGETVPNIVRYYISQEGERLEKVMPPAGPEGAYKRKNGIDDIYYNQVLDELIAIETRKYSDPQSAPSYNEMRRLLPWDERINTKNESRYEERRTAFHSGWLVQVCNNIEGHDFSDIDYSWYIKEAEKLCLLQGA